MINTENAIKILKDFHRNEFRNNKERLLDTIYKHPFVVNNQLSGDYLTKCFVRESIFYIPVFNFDNVNAGYVGYDESNCSVYFFDLSQPHYSLISSFNPAFSKQEDKNIIVHDDETAVFLAPDFITSACFYEINKQKFENLKRPFIISSFFGADYIDGITTHMITNVHNEYIHSFVLNNTHLANQEYYANKLVIASNESNTRLKAKYFYPPTQYKTYLEYHLDNDSTKPPRDEVSDTIMHKDVDYKNHPVETIIETIPELKEMVNIETSINMKQNSSALMKENICKPTEKYEYPEVINLIIDTIHNQKPEEPKTLNFFEETLESLSKEYINIPKKHLEGLLRNIVGNMFQRMVKFNPRTPITEQSLFVLSSGEGKTSLAEALTDRITEFYNNIEYEIYQGLFADYIATKDFLENEAKDNKTNLAKLKEIQLAILKNEDKKPYCQTLMQTMNTSVFNIPEEVLKGARQNWLFSDEAGATMNSNTWKGEFGNALIQYMCGAWSDTCKLSAFKTDAKNKPAGRASKSEVKDCSQGMLAMTQHGFFDKLDKEMWLDGGWLARLNLYICNRSPLTIKDRDKIIDAGSKFQNELINLYQKVLSVKTDGYLCPMISEQVKQMFKDAEFKAVQLANLKKDEAFDPIYNRMKEKATRTATIYALIEYLNNDKFEITAEIADKAITDTWYNIGQAIDFIIQTRTETFESNPEELEAYILKAQKTVKKGNLITIKDICKQAPNKTRQNTLLKNKEVIFDYLDNRKDKVLRIADGENVYWFDVIKSGVVRINYKLKWREGFTNIPDYENKEPVSITA